MFKRFPSLLVVAHAFLSQSAYSAPANDNLSAAIVVPGSGNSSNTTNIAATTESGERAHAGTVALKSIWWKWTCPTPAPAVAQMDTIGSNFDTRLGVYFDAGGSLQAVGSNDDSNFATGTTVANRYSVVRIRPVATHTYFMAVDGFNGATGNVTFSVKTGASAGLPPANDNAASATSIGEVETLWGDTTPATVSEFDTPIENPPVTDRAAGRQLWYSYTPNVSATRLVSLRSPTRLLQAIIFSSGVGLTRMGTAGNLNSPPSDWTGSAFNFVAGTTYYICVISTSTSERHGPFELAVEPLPVNDNLTAATVITAQSWALNFNTLAASRESGEPLTNGGTTARTLWYRWQVPVTGLAWIDTQDSALDTAMDFHLLQDTTLPVNFAKLNLHTFVRDDVQPGQVKQSKLEATEVTAGAVYYLQVSGEREENGRGRLFGTIVPTGSSRNAYTLWSLDRWRLRGSNTAPNEDYDGDGISNILEWFYGTNPLRPFTAYCDPQSGLFLPVTLTTYNPSARQLSQVIPQAPVNTSMSSLLPDLAVTAEHSSILSGWQTAIGPTPTWNLTPPPSPFWTTAEIRTPFFPANERKHFLRLKITLP